MGWTVTPQKDELLLEFWNDKQLLVIVSVEKDGIGYAIRDTADFKFRCGKHDPDTDFEGAMAEIETFVSHSQATSQHCRGERQ